MLIYSLDVLGGIAERIEEKALSQLHELMEAYKKNGYPDVRMAHVEQIVKQHKLCRTRLDQVAESIAVMDQFDVNNRD